ncbi:PREDICTED: uncharacterized protein LOC109117159 [Tarenaya hassleriana]|uniref:uncharacterized protein LOC109117159 n=1 Tax=Tarenaya hassleriana TaxID=28532 RepID=UPI0008FD93AB|nr:PREDICTED: uncharacterized protein LOC109117159 [Tarenaya hassleriana]
MSIQEWLLLMSHSTCNSQSQLPPALSSLLVEGVAQNTSSGVYAPGVSFFTIVISLYVDDLLVTGSCVQEIEKVKKELMSLFEMSDLGQVSFFLGIEINQSKGEIILCQRKYLSEILKKFKFDGCKSVRTPMNMKEKLVIEETKEEVDERNYRSLVGCLMYLTTSRPDVLFAVNVLSRFLNNPRRSHLVAAKRVLRYLKGTLDYGVLFKSDFEADLVGFADSDCVGSTQDMKSTSGFCFMLGSNCFSWSSKKEELVAQSTAEAEFIATTTAANQAIWLRKILCDLGFNPRIPTQINVDNQAAIAISKNPVFNLMSKFIFKKANKYFISARSFLYGEY